jgi:hypothetical protein
MAIVGSVVLSHHDLHLLVLSLDTDEGEAEPSDCKSLTASRDMVRFDWAV